MANRGIKSITISGYDLSYLVEGEGEPVLFIHGITTYSFIWRDLVPLLKDRYQVISLDLLGCGNSAKPLTISYSLRNQADLISQFMVKLGLGKTHVVGHDLGGGIGQILAVTNPELLIDLTLINSVGYDLWPVQPITTMRTPIIRQLAMATLDLGALRYVVKRGMFHKDRLTEELLDLFWEPLKSKSGRKAFLHFANCLDNRNLLDIEKDLCRLDLPVVILRGDADTYLSGTISERLHHDIPQSSLVKIASGGHFIQIDEPELLVKEMLILFNA